MIKVLATGSKGNSYIVQAGEEILLLELGINFKEVLKGLKFNLNNVVGCLVSHVHKDHSKGIKQALKHSLNVYCNEDVANSVTTDKRRIKVIEPLKKFKVGGFTILPFDCQHTNNDGSVCPNLGFLISHKALGKVLFATDTYYLKYTFKGLEHVLIECNYSERDLNMIPPERVRTLSSHMSLEILKETLKSWDLSNTKDITLIHLSGEYGDPNYFKEEIQKATGCIVNVAGTGVKI
ncbi:MBL fold metallo-hydrolase [Clostridium sp. Ade.TY]|uniref:MBL fold metallo-hydrolase n=1 Tax=Clostridium sp. Ade.TY TaxID=1391647 RepID=UPI00042851B1|nr:MBL fold metallo-hydrolase [Clostridium sp. Ade.TY]